MAERPKDLIYARDEKPPAVPLIAIGFQHVAVICPYLVMVALVAEALGVRDEGASDEHAGSAAAAALRQLVKDAGVADRLRDWGVEEADLAPLADATAMTPANPRKVESREQILEILRAVY